MGLFRKSLLCKKLQIFSKSTFDSKFHIIKYEGLRENVFFEKRCCFLPVWTFLTGPKYTFQKKMPYFDLHRLFQHAHTK